MAHSLKYATLAVLAIGSGLIIRDLWPKREVVYQPPRITTHYDTVRTVDTQWVTRLRTVHDTVNTLERIVVTVPETVAVLPSSIAGVTAIRVAPRVGDSTLVTGFSFTRDSSHYIRRTWAGNYYTAGPFRGLVLDSVPPRVLWWPYHPVQECKFFCKVKHYTIGGLVGAAIYGVLH